MFGKESKCIPENREKENKRRGEEEWEMVLLKQYILKASFPMVFVRIVERSKGMNNSSSSCHYICQQQ